LERGAIVNASALVVESVARALQLDDAGRADLHRMVGSGSAAFGRPMLRSSIRPANFARYQFLEPSATSPRIGTS